MGKFNKAGCLVPSSLGFPLLADCVQIGLPVLILLILTQQYLRRLHAKADDILERFALLACIAVVWAFAAILTVAGAYNNSKARTQTRLNRHYHFSGHLSLLLSQPVLTSPRLGFLVQHHLLHMCSAEASGSRALHLLKMLVYSVSLI
ncbi:hypothetical protein P8452_22276 [Trifolium repens]|nr:hypothetical protein P8452_22276 [Trifolium repens]